MGVAIPFAMPNKIFDGPVFNKIAIRALRIFAWDYSLIFLGK